ncbi:hypothetical protein ASE75_08220 [Sphingomonas sp. Leaf17]|nr:hypothetical protein ASE75_08220 [Sphingomonas sp. Leaf17]
MEEILSSIKRIIAEEESGAPARPRRARTPSRLLDEDGDEDEILELSDPIPAPARPEPVPQRPVFAKVTPEPRAQAPAAPAPPPIAAPAAAEPDPDPIVSTRAASATRGSLDALTRMVVKPEPGSDGTLEGLVRDLLRPMLAEWLDSHLPDMVEAMVAKEIARISSQQR